jgi:long-subunit fatty acid transport protein
MNRKISIFCLIALIIFPTLALAQVELTTFAGRGKVGTTGLQFLKIGVGARAVAMGEAFIALANDASAMYYNPAGLNQIKEREVFFSLTQWPADIQFGYVGFALPAATLGTFGVHVGALTTGEMKRTIPYKGWTGEYFSATDWVAGISYSRGLTDKFSIGGNVKLVAEFLDDEHIMSWAADFGTIFDIGVRNMKFAMCITNFGPNIKYISEEFSMPISFKIGGIVQVLQWSDNSIMATLEGNHPNDNVEQVALGVEYTFRDMVALRGGYRVFIMLEDKDRTVEIGQKSIDVEEPLNGFSFGAGINLPISNTRTRIDYAYSDLGFLQYAQRLSVTFNF